MINYVLKFLIALLIIQTPALAQKQLSKKWENLLDEKLSKWEVWTGVPHESVKSIPLDYQKEPDGSHKKPIGLGDPLNIYKVTKDEQGNLILNISGEVYAGLTSLVDYKNYHLTLLFKWGEKKYAPRLEAKRDSGLLYHCYGDHGAFWNVWMRCLESQIQEGDFGDLYAIAGTKSKVRIDDTKHWDPKSEKTSKTGKRSKDYENPHGEWTRVDIYVFEDKAMHLTNGKVVLALTDAKTHKGKSLTSGKIQIQSEGAEAYAKDIKIRAIKKLPKKLRKAANI